MNNTINTAALEPLFPPNQEPNRHRIKASKEGEPALILNTRRPSPIVLAQNLRLVLKEWRDSDYPGVSDTTRELLHFWFNRDHSIKLKNGEESPFNYYFCQREAIETLIYLKEVRGIDTQYSLISEFGDDDKETASRGVNPEEDFWSKYAFKVATGAGKTKIMSLAIVWSYFHSRYESNSPMPKHFLLIAPGVTVFERLKEDFENGKIFDIDPLIPPHWKGDWNLSVVLQDEGGISATDGILYLTNIQRLYERKSRNNNKEESYDWFGPPVSKAKALELGESLRQKITSHKNIMVLNDEAHHVWDPESAWHEAISFLHNEINKKTDGGIFAQLDFSATPKDDKGQVFKNVICDTPLGEAVDAGIVKTPVLGRAEDLSERPSDDASIVYEKHLKLGYERWKKSKEEWEKSGKKPLLFIMTSDTKEADEIAKRLNIDPIYKELNNRTINLHTRLKGKIKKTGKGINQKIEFIENEKEISSEDLKELRKLSRELDSNSSQYYCIVSVLMLREGWDVKNVTTIVPLRPLTARSKILPEQTLGRGLRRMTPLGQANEIVTVIEHPSFIDLYKEQLDQEGVSVEVLDIEKIPQTTITIYPDTNKDTEKLNIVIPSISAGYSKKTELKDLTIEKIKKEFEKYTPLPVGEKSKTEIQYEGKTLLTGEVVEQMKIQIGLLESGYGAISYYREYLEKHCGIKGTHIVLAPILETFITTILFEKKVDLNDITNRLGDSDIKEHVFATFVPLIRAHITELKDRISEGVDISVKEWKPFQVTHSTNRPAIIANKSLFNLTPCNLDFEVAFTKFADRAEDIVSICKNAGPQALRIDYINSSLQTSYYFPDFLVKLKNGDFLLVETKGQADREVSYKAKAAVSWCEAASKDQFKWHYLYVTEGKFNKFNSSKLVDLVRTCKPDLVRLLEDSSSLQTKLDLTNLQAKQVVGISFFIDTKVFEELPPAYQKIIKESVSLYEFISKTEGSSFAPAFNILLKPYDDLTKAIIIEVLTLYIPTSIQDQKSFFEPYYDKRSQHLREVADNLKRTLIYRSGKSYIGLLKFCLDYANGNDITDGVFDAIRLGFNPYLKTELPSIIKTVNDFRNTYIAHQNKELLDSKIATKNLEIWIQGLAKAHNIHHKNELKIT